MAKYPKWNHGEKDFITCKSSMSLTLICCDVEVLVHIKLPVYGKVIHGVKKPMEQTMLFRSIYAIFLCDSVFRSVL